MIETYTSKENYSPPQPQITWPQALSLQFSTTRNQKFMKLITLLVEVNKHIHSYVLKITR